MKIVYSDPKTGKTGQVEVQDAAYLMNRRIGEVIEGTPLGLTGFKLKITGGSSKSGFPMNRSIEGQVKVKPLVVIAKTGKDKGQSMRLSMVGNTIGLNIEQVNTTIVEYGSKPMEELFKPKEKKEGEKEEKKPEGKKGKK